MARRCYFSNGILLLLQNNYKFYYGFAVLAKFVTYDELLTTGLEAYWNEEWEDTIMYFEKALQNFKYVIQTEPTMLLTI